METYFNTIIYMHSLYLICRYTRPGIDFNGENMQKNGENDRNTQKIGHRCPKKRVLGKIKLRDFQYILMTPIQGNIMQKNGILGLA